MSLIIKVAGADFSATELPKLKQSVLGFPGFGLAGLYLFEDGVVGSPHSGQFLDDSGKGNTASIYSNFSSPVVRDYGVEITDTDGLIIDTGIPQGADFTVIGCLSNTIDTSLVDGFPAWFTDTGNNIPVAKGSEGSHDLRIVMNALLSDAANSNGAYDVSNTLLGKVRPGIDETLYGSANQPGILSLRVSSADGAVDIKTLSGYSLSTTSVPAAAMYSNLTAESMVVGLWPHTGAKGISGRLYGFAIYDRALNDEEVVEAMAAMNTRVSARGVVVVS